MRTRVLTAEEEQTVVTLRSEPHRKSIDHIAKQLHCGPGLVRQALAKHGMNSSARIIKRRLLFQQVAFACGRHRFEHTPVEIMAAQYGVAAVTLRQAMVAAGARFRKYGRRRADEPEHEAIFTDSDCGNRLMLNCLRLPLPLPAGVFAA